MIGSPAHEPAPLDQIGNALMIHQLLALYGHVIDEGEWHRLHEIFTPDVLFDSSQFVGGSVTEGLDVLRADWMLPDKQHPLAHHATNIVITALDQNEAQVLSKGLGVGRNGRVGSVTYRDVLRRTPGGWRIARRIASLRGA